MLDGRGQVVGANEGVDERLAQIVGQDVVTVVVAAVGAVAGVVEHGRGVVAAVGGQPLLEPRQPTVDTLARGVGAIQQAHIQRRVGTTLRVSQHGVQRSCILGARRQGVARNKAVVDADQQCVAVSELLLRHVGPYDAGLYNKTFQRLGS